MLTGFTSAGSRLQGYNRFMKLATYRDGSRDGQLIVVARDLGTAHYASGVAQRLQQALDDWNFFAPQLQDIYDELNAGRARHAFAFDAQHCLAPLPRAYQRTQVAPWGAEPYDQPPLHWETGDALHGACAAIAVLTDAPLDFAAGLAVVTGDVGAGTHAAVASETIRLMMLAAPLLRTPRGPERACAFSPVAVTPDELGDAWHEGRVHLPLQVLRNGRKFGLCDMGSDMTTPWGSLIAQWAATRPRASGSIMVAAPVRNADTARGFCSITDRRAMEERQSNAPLTPFLSAGDSLRIEVKRRNGQSLFGAIDLLFRPAEV